MTCKSYVGVACVDGSSCPVIWSDRYDTPASKLSVDCSNCFYNKGCEDCALAGTEHCTQIRKNTNDNT